MDPSPDAARKAALRGTALAARRALPGADRREASQRAVARLLVLPEVRRARTVLLYAAVDDEADPATALKVLIDRGVRTLYPRVRGDHLDLVAAADLMTLTLGYRGIKEPVGPAIDPEVVDLAVIPGVAFDRLGGRLGQGGGHYDRLLARMPPETVRVGFAFACQVVPRVPREDHDQAVDIVVTEAGAHRTGARDGDAAG